MYTYFILLFWYLVISFYIIFLTLFGTLERSAWKYLIIKSEYFNKMWVGKWVEESMEAAWLLKVWCLIQFPSDFWKFLIRNQIPILEMNGSVEKGIQLYFQKFSISLHVYLSMQQVSP